MTNVCPICNELHPEGPCPQEYPDTGERKCFLCGGPNPDRYIMTVGYFHDACTKQWKNFYE